MAKPETQEARSARADRSVFRAIMTLIIGMIISAACTAGICLLLYFHQQQQYNSSLKHQQQLYVSEQQQSEAQGAKIERSLCLTLDRLAANKPPAGNPNTNPSRAYDQANHAILAQLGPDLECK